MKTIWSCLICLIGTASHASLLGLYTFDNATAEDISGNDSHGTLGDGPGLVAPEFQAGSGINGSGAFLFKGYQLGADRTSIRLPIDASHAATPIITMGVWARVRYIYATSFNPITNPTIQQIMSADDGGYDRTMSYDPRGSNPYDPNYPWRWSAFGGSQGVVGSNFQGGGWRMIALRHNQLTGEMSFNVMIEGGSSAQINRSGAYYDSSSRDFIRLGTSATAEFFDEPFDGWLDNAFVLDRWLSDEELQEVYNTKATSLVPEPGTWALGLGMATILRAKARRKRA